MYRKADNLGDPIGALLPRLGDPLYLNLQEMIATSILYLPEGSHIRRLLPTDPRHTDHLHMNYFSFSKVHHGHKSWEDTVILRSARCLITIAGAYVMAL